jgi:hypothetical protein
MSRHYTFARIVNGQWKSTILTGLVLLLAATGFVIAQRSGPSFIEPPPLPHDLWVTSNIVGVGLTNIAEAPKRKRVTARSKFVAKECPFCGRKNVPSFKVGIIQTTELTNGIKVDWQIDFMCRCEAKFRDTRTTLAPKVESTQVE